MKKTFIIPGRLPGLNEIIGKAYANRYSANALKKRTQKFIAEHILFWQVPIFTDPVTISFEWIEPDKRRDIDNICAGGRKYILDALVQAGRLHDDSRKYIRGFTDMFPDPDKTNPRVIIVIQSLSDSPTLPPSVAE